MEDWLDKHGLTGIAGFVIVILIIAIVLVAGNLVFGKSASHNHGSNTPDCSGGYQWCN